LPFFPALAPSPENAQIKLRNASVFSFKVGVGAKFCMDNFCEFQPQIEKRFSWFFFSLFFLFLLPPEFGQAGLNVVPSSPRFVS
jgi:hypothetical protein